MSLFKKLFSSNKKEQNTSPSPEPALRDVHTKETFQERYTKETLSPGMLDGCLKMVESYFLDNKIERLISSPVHHPANLDQLMNDGFGFSLYCKAFQMDDNQAVMIMATAFSNYLHLHFGFQLYKDKTPEHPLRSMTLKYEKDGVVLSLYPFEYAAKVLAYEASFEELHQRIATQIHTMPNADGLLNDLKEE